MIKIPVIEWEHPEEFKFQAVVGEYHLRVEIVLPRFMIGWIVEYRNKFIGSGSVITELEAKLFAEITFIRHLVEKEGIVTILDVLHLTGHELQDAEPRIDKIEKIHKRIEGMIVLLKKGYSLNEDVSPLVGKYGNVDDVPEKKPSIQKVTT